MTRADHWQQVYTSKADHELSWTQPEPAVSLKLIREVCPSGRVIDIGGWASPLVARLLDVGYVVSVLDISPAALERARRTLGERSARVRWLAADITATPDIGPHEVWHDRAVFHFLTDPIDRAAYHAALRRALVPGGYAVIATFAPDGPERCSGLPVQRYSPQTLTEELGPSFTLVHAEHEMHTTPWGKPQAFQYSVLRYARVASESM